MKKATIKMVIIKFAVLIIFLASFGFLFGYLTAYQKNTSTADGHRFPPHAQEPLSSIESPPTQGNIVEYTFKPGDTFYDVLCTLGLSPQEIFSILEKSKRVYDLKKIKPGNYMTIKYKPITHSLLRLEYTIDDQHQLIVTKTDDGYHVSQEPAIFHTKLRVIKGTISNNLFDDGIKAGCPPQLILSFADIFAWDVDFLTDLRENDTFIILFEELYKNNQFFKHGRILAAEFINRERNLRAFYFAPPHGKGEYYNERGESMARQFLKSPLRFNRISSHFSQRRFHPILRIYRPHLGVDYAAPIGTPIESTADGIITFIGWKGGYGKCVTIQHNNSYSSHYGHLSRFAKGMKKGKEVSQGEVIGYVGATGLATGPHLDYRLKRGQDFINPLTLVSPRSHTIPQGLHPQFRAHTLLLSSTLAMSDGTLIHAKADASP